MTHPCIGAQTKPLGQDSPSSAWFREEEDERARIHERGSKRRHDGDEERLHGLRTHPCMAAQTNHVGRGLPRRQSWDGDEEQLACGCIPPWAPKQSQEDTSLPGRPGFLHP